MAIHMLEQTYTHLSNNKVCVVHNRVAFLDCIQGGGACTITPSLRALLLWSSINNLPAIKPIWQIGTSYPHFIPHVEVPWGGREGGRGGGEGGREGGRKGGREEEREGGREGEREGGREGEREGGREGGGREGGRERGRERGREGGREGEGGTPHSHVLGYTIHTVNQCHL